MKGFKPNDIKRVLKSLKDNEPNGISMKDQKSNHFRIMLYRHHCREILLVAIKKSNNKALKKYAPIISKRSTISLSYSLGDSLYNTLNVAIYGKHLIAKITHIANHDAKQLIKVMNAGTKEIITKVCYSKPKHHLCKSEQEVLNKRMFPNRKYQRRHYHELQQQVSEISNQQAKLNHTMSNEKKRRKQLLHKSKQITKQFKALGKVLHHENIVIEAHRRKTHAKKVEQKKLQVKHEQQLQRKEKQRDAKQRKQKQHLDHIKKHQQYIKRALAIKAYQIKHSHELKVAKQERIKAQAKIKHEQNNLLEISNNRQLALNALAYSIYNWNASRNHQSTFIFNHKHYVTRHIPDFPASRKLHNQIALLYVKVNQAKAINKDNKLLLRIVKLYLEDQNTLVEA